MPEEALMELELALLPLLISLEQPLDPNRMHPMLHTNAQVLSFMRITPPFHYCLTFLIKQSTLTGHRFIPGIEGVCSIT